MKKIYLATFLILLSHSVLASRYSMRDCMLLPITDNIGDALAYKVYEDTEKYLKVSNWCSYRPSSELLSVFSKYRDKLDQHLDDPSVIRTVAEKLKVGTLIKVQMSGTSESVTLEMKVYGENGKDVYLSEKVLLNKVDLFLIGQTLKNWLELYEAAIPYDGRVLGALGNQVTFKVGNKKDFKLEQKVSIRKLVRKKEHPLLQKIVAWESIEVGYGKIKNISHDQGLIMIDNFTSKNKIVKDDWVVIGSDEESEDSVFRVQKNDEKYSFGRLGEIELNLILSSLNVGVSKSSGNFKLAGYIYGINSKIEAWLTREYFVIGELSRHIGSVESISGSPSADNVNVTTGHYKIGGGYKYLPMGFFYGPQVNLYGGLASYFYDLEDSAADFLGEGSVSGIFLGVSGDMPLKKGLRLYGKGEIIPFSEFKEEGNIYPSAKNSSSMVFEVGAKLQYNPVTKVVAGMEILNNSAKFNSGLSEINYKETVFKVGLNYTF